MTKVAVTSSGVAIGYSTEGLGYAIKSSNAEIPERCVSMILTNDASVASISSHYYYIHDIVDQKDFEWLAIDSEFERIADSFKYKVASFTEDPKVNNPC